MAVNDPLHPWRRGLWTGTCTGGEKGEQLCLASWEEEACALTGSEEMQLGYCRSCFSELGDWCTGRSDASCGWQRASAARDDGRHSRLSGWQTTQGRSNDIARRGMELRRTSVASALVRTGWQLEPLLSKRAYYAHARDRQRRPGQPIGTLHVAA
jgi:hypothetical protein